MAHRTEWGALKQQIDFAKFEQSIDLGPHVVMFENRIGALCEQALSRELIVASGEDYA